MARNLVRHGLLTWNPGAITAESYPSALWIAIAAAAEHRYFSPVVITQGLGILCGLGTVVALAQFSAKRMAGLIAPLLLASSGAAAAAGASGTEAPLAMLVVTTAFLAFEWGWKRILALALGLLVATRPEGFPLAIAFLILERFDRPVNRQGLRRPSLVRWYVVPLVACLGMLAYRMLVLDSALSPFGRTIATFDGERILLGLAYLESYFVCSGSAPLLVLPAGLLLTGRLPGRARRALLLFFVWAAVVAWGGGDGLPFWNGLAAVVPLSLLSIQGSITWIMDRWRRFFAIGWALLALAFGFSFLTSKVPGDIGPLPLEEIHRTWMRPSPTLAAAYDRPLGRLGLLQEIREVEHLRPLGIFLRDNVKDPSSIATFWPGAVGYLSRKRIYDLLGRAYPTQGSLTTVSWRGRKRVDLVREIERGADYIVPLIGALAEGMTATDFVESWQKRFDADPPSDERMRQLITALGQYELVSVPVPDQGQEAESPATNPFLLLRKKELELTPRVEAGLEGGVLEVLVHHRGHHQVVDLVVRATGATGEEFRLRPTGEWIAEGEKVAARTSILLYETGPRPILLLRGELPAGVETGTLHVQLHNPGMRSSGALSTVSAPVRVPFP